MKITRTLTSEIKQAVEARRGGRVKLEVGCREVPAFDDPQYNSLLWSEDADLYDLTPLHKLAGEYIPDVDGEIELDIYVYRVNKDLGEWELDENFMALVLDGRLLQLLSTEELIERQRRRDQMIEESAAFLKR